MEERLYDIGEVCRILDTTSRTLRFYEEKGIVASTSVPFKSRRHYTKEQIDHIRKVMVLRALGLSIAQISELQKGQVDLSQAILERRAHIYALLNEKVREIHLLNEALAIIGDGRDVFDYNGGRTENRGDERLAKIVRFCGEAIVRNDTDALYRHLSDKMIEYMPRESYEKVREDTFLPVGGFVSLGAPVCDEQYANVWYQIIKFERLNVKIQIVFCGEKVNGLWLLYCEE
ncbi:MAG: MerR family transcriptional regulator [Clostridia bacterium]|nr:MerR family transcriptional regulator [Clostridia bacterium]